MEIGALHRACPRRHLARAIALGLIVLGSACQRTTSGPGEPGDRGLAAAGSESIEGTFQVKWGDPPDGPPVMKFSVAESGT